MTRHNLEVHLKWLLKQGPSLYPSLSPSPRVSSDVSAAQRPAGNPSIPTPNAPAGQIASSAIDDTESAQDTFVDDDLEVGAGTESDINMARLLFAPSSSRKPRLLSQSKDPIPGLPKTPNARSSLDTPKPSRTGLPQTSAKGISPSIHFSEWRKLTTVGLKRQPKRAPICSRCRSAHGYATTCEVAF